MDFTIGADVEALVDLTRRVLAKEVAGAERDGGVGLPHHGERWARLADVGLGALSLDAAAQGLGLDLLEICAVVREVGAALVGEPVVTTNLATMAAAAAGLHDLAGLIASGSRLAAWGHTSSGLRLDGGELSGRIQALGWAGDDVDLLVVTDDRQTMIVEGVPKPRVIDGRDLLRPRWEFELAGQRVVAAGEDTLPPGGLESRARVLLAAELLGGSDAVLLSTVRYVCEREQFGRPVGSFQAVKHQLADVFAHVAQAQALVERAAITIEAGGRMGVVAAAWLCAKDSAVEAADRSVHLHGGMGLAWETGLHLHLRRALSLEAVLGTRQELRRAVAEDLATLEDERVGA